MSNELTKYLKRSTVGENSSSTHARSLSLLSPLSVPIIDDANGDSSSSTVTAQCSPPLQRRGALLILRRTTTGEKPFSFLFSFFLFFSFIASSSSRTRDACRTVAASVPLASFHSTQRPPLRWSIALATRRHPLKCNLLTPAFLLLCSSISSRIQVKGKRTRKKEQKEQCRCNIGCSLGILAAGAYGLPQFRLRVFLWDAKPSKNCKVSCYLFSQIPLYISLTLAHNKDVVEHFFFKNGTN
ncbi:hypothetical protein Ahy_A10g050948 [Arachis hypogaea]|uniref:Uncharacterized protein n=1 Tax=Arachis hypogaea TaxID=3818 RepID=A0A445BAY0_ARAHY|nr:hypothetical protein Ahy_A10g050948 [Arachis hypogaea]